MHLGVRFLLFSFVLCIYNSVDKSAKMYSMSTFSSTLYSQAEAQKE